MGEKNTSCQEEEYPQREKRGKLRKKLTKTKGKLHQGEDITE